MKLLKELMDYIQENWASKMDFIIFTDISNTAQELIAKEKEEKNRPKIVCLCGSTRFMDYFFEAGWNFTLQGYIVLSVGVCKHTDAEGGHGAEAISQEVADKLDELHLRKIDMADEVFILNVDGYIGKSTTKEIEYAIKTKKPVRFLHGNIPDKFQGIS